MHNPTNTVDAEQGRRVGRPKRPNFFRLHRAIIHAYGQLGPTLSVVLQVYLAHGDENDVTYISPAGVARVMGLKNDRQVKRWVADLVGRGWLRKVAAPKGRPRPTGSRGPVAFHQVCVPDETVAHDATVRSETVADDATVWGGETVASGAPKQWRGAPENGGVRRTETVASHATRTKGNKQEQTHTTNGSCVSVLIRAGVGADAAQKLAQVAAAQGRSEEYVADVVDYARDHADNPPGFIRYCLLNDFYQLRTNPGTSSDDPPSRDPTDEEVAMAFADAGEGE